MSHSILVLEDDAGTRELIVATLREASFVAHAHADTLERLPDVPDVPDARAQSVGVIVVALGEPKCDGAAQLRRLRERYPHARIVAISGRFRFNVGTAASVARQLGADRVIAKPLDCAALLANVRQLMTSLAS
ncbi:response regulator [Paraburkholderia unamae]|uniref:Response regulator receiver domain-containing protein n=1 Tax=Paraburkholderia unamae TaxID=219649 RepID=A0ABX5KC04_9BURK|nr:response regulator [Paraburkholderia unamae]PVX70733.1 response regulator receiver domain-containing protein [Paraburkholderia unamae]